jgi:hypothetical protein
MVLDVPTLQKQHRMTFPFKRAQIVGVRIEG